MISALMVRSLKPILPKLNFSVDYYVCVCACVVMHRISQHVHSFTCMIRPIS